ncbi:MAG: RICIN domain-containing protein [Proteobacteria bacterium]|nr:RICIN domain-containing protein [Pseudomonadota bacterium]
MENQSIGTKICIYLLLLLVMSACGRRSGESPSLKPDSNAAANIKADNEEKTKDLEKLIRDQSSALDKLNQDKTGLQERSVVLDSKIKELSGELENNKTLTEAQKKQLVLQIDQNKAEKENLQKSIDDLNKRNAELQKQLEAVKAANTKLQNELNTAKQQAGATPVAAGASAKTAGTATVATLGFYTFKYADPAKLKNDCLTVPGDSTVENVQILSSICTPGSTSQHFLAVDSTVNNFFQIIGRHSAKCLTVSSLTENTSVQQRTCLGGDDQTWEFYVRGDLDFRLRNKASGKCMKIQFDGKIVQGDCQTNYSFFNWSSVGS